MNKDYLWNKAGEDAEIEKMENALKAFRCKETNAPALPRKVMLHKTEMPRRFFRFSLAFAACAAVVIVSLGVWFELSIGKIENVNDLSQTITPPIKIEFAIDSTVTKADKAIVRKVESPKQISQPKVVRIKKPIPAIARRSDEIAKNFKAEKPPVKLTKEEKYAYDQLMLALSITSSKLKLVQNKVEGIDEQTVVLRREK